MGGRRPHQTKEPDQVEVVNPYDSLRFRACGRKRAYATDGAARQAAAFALEKFGTEMHIYRCQFCRMRHLTSKELQTSQRTKLRETARVLAKEKS